MLWHGVIGQSWLSSCWSLQPTRESWESQHPRADLSPPCPRASHVFLRSRVQASHSPSVGLSSLPKSQVDWDTQHGSLPKATVHPCNLFLLSFLPEAQITTWSLSFPSYSVTCVIFLIALVVESFCQFLVSFQWELFPMWMCVWRVRRGGEPHILLLPYLNLCPEVTIL